MLLGGARKIRTSCRRGTARPCERTTGSDMRREELILEVSVLEADTLHELEDPLRFSDIPRERLLARDAFERAATALDCANDFLDVLNAGLIWSREPDGGDRGVFHHRCDSR